MADLKNIQLELSKAELLKVKSLIRQGIYTNFTDFIKQSIQEQIKTHPKAAQKDPVLIRPWMQIGL